MLFKRDRRVKFQFVEKHRTELDWVEIQRCKVVFLDEGKFNLCGLDGERYVRRHVREYHQKCIKLTVESRGG